MLNVILVTRVFYLELRIKLTTANSILSTPSVSGSRSLAALPETRSSETTPREKNMVELFFLKKNTIAVSTESDGSYLADDRDIGSCVLLSLLSRR